MQYMNHTFFEMPTIPSYLLQFQIPVCQYEIVHFFHVILHDSVGVAHQEPTSNHVESC